MTNYGKIDILWYDVDWPLTAEQWESERMNEMVFSLQPEIIVNNRNGCRAISPRRSSTSRLPKQGAHGKPA
jgi:alpha-L-fucosidase